MKTHMSCRHVFYKVLGTKVIKKKEKVILESEEKFQERKMYCMGDGKNCVRS
jgi:hypothetical protein